MQNAPNAPSAPPSKGFASIITLVSNVSAELTALEKAVTVPPPAVAAPQPVRLGPSRPVPEAPAFSSAARPLQTAPSYGLPVWAYLLIIITVLRVLAALFS